METGSRGGLDLLKSTTISLVLVAFSCRWLCLHHCTKLSTRLLYSPSCPSLIHPTTAESSENFWMWHDSLLEVKSDVYRVNRTGEGIVPCGAPVLHSSLRYAVFQPDKLWPLRQVVSDPGYHLDVHTHLHKLVTQ